jgi:replicative DNA helicase
MHPHDLDPDMLPWSHDAECAVLGVLLMDNAAWDRVGNIIEAKHFYELSHGVIFSAIGALILANKSADVFTVLDALQKLGKAEEIGGVSYLHALAQQVPSSRGAQRYAEIIAERALMRGLQESAEEVKRLAVQPGLSVAERLDRAQGVLQGLQVGGGRAMPTPIQDNVVRLIERVQAAADGEDQRLMPTGIFGLDRLLGGGLRGGKQIILAARPSVGKSSLAQQLCLTLAQAGHPTAFFSQEMSKDELTDRAVSNLGHLELDRVISGKLEEGEWSRLTEGIERLRNLPLYLDDQPALTLYDISAKARMLKRQHAIRLIVIDYLQLCSSSGKAADNRHHQIEELSRGLKNLARQLDIAILSLSQLNREVEKRTSGRPILSDLKESGSIEEDADIVILLSRGVVDPSGFQTINCDIPKNRQGRVGSLTLGFNGAHQQWHESAMPISFKTPARKHYTEDV